MTHVRFRDSNTREVGDNSPKFVCIPRKLTRRLLLFGNKYKIALRDYQCAGGHKIALKPADDSRPLQRGEQALPFGPIK
jgi:hypothetical protein